MKPQVKYIELKTGYSNNGPAWIGLVSFSKTGNTIYFNGQAFRKGSGVSGNFFDVVSGDEYWISGVKRDMTDRHYTGGGPIYIERRILDEYLKIINVTSLDSDKYPVIDVVTETSKLQFHELENEKNEEDRHDMFLHFKEPHDLSIIELQHVITDLEEKEKQAKFNKARRSYKHAKAIFETELERRISKS